MSKRGKSSGGSVTGGTGDVKPQQLTFQGAVVTTGEYTVERIQLPISRYSHKTGRANIIEILKVYWYPQMANFADTSWLVMGYLTTGTQRVTANTLTAATFQDDMGDPRTFAGVYLNQTITTSGVNSQEYPLRVDLTDNNGNGLLVATDDLIVVTGGVGLATAGRTTCKILYRIVGVALTEYIGIVQSQQ